MPIPLSHFPYFPLSTLLYSPSDAVQLALIANIGMIILQLLKMVTDKKNREKDVEERAEIAQKVDNHSELINQKLDEQAKELSNNTAITAQGYADANNYAGKLERLDGMDATMKRIEASMAAENGRMRRNTHKIHNALNTLLLKFDLEGFELEKKPDDILDDQPDPAPNGAQSSLSSHNPEDKITTKE